MIRSFAHEVTEHIWKGERSRRCASAPPVVTPADTTTAYCLRIEPVLIERLPQFWSLQP